MSRFDDPRTKELIPVSMSALAPASVEAVGAFFLFSPEFVPFIDLLRSGHVETGRAVEIGIDETSTRS
jgi:hypothetical protein